RPRSKAVIEPPVMQNRTRKSIVPHVRHVIRKGRREIVAYIEVAIPSLIALQTSQIVHGVIVQAVRPGVGSQRGQTPAQSPLELNLQRIVIRCQAVLNDKKGTCKWVGRARKLILLQQPRRMRSHIGDSESLRLPKGLLEAGVPLERIRQLQMRSKASRTGESACRGVHDWGNH